MVRIFSEKIRKFGAMEQESGYYTVKSSVYARKLLIIVLSRFWWVAALPIAVLFVLAWSDNRFFYVAFMALLIVIPGVLAMVYFRWALSPEIAVRMIPQRITRSDAGFTIEYQPQPDDRFTPPSENILKKEIVQVEDTGKYTTLFLSSSPYSIVIIPSEIAVKLDLA